MKLGKTDKLILLTNFFLKKLWMKNWLSEKSAVSRKNYHKYWFIVLFVLGICFLFDLFHFKFNVDKEEVVFTCGDGTPYGNCSENKPYYCDEGYLIRNMEKCGCPEIFLNLEEIVLLVIMKMEKKLLWIM